MAETDNTPKLAVLMAAARAAAAESHEEVVAKAHELLATLPADHPRRALAEEAVRQIEASDSPWVLAG